MTDKQRLINADKLIKWFAHSPDSDGFLEGSSCVNSFNSLTDAISSGLFDPDPPQQPDIQPGDRVRHKHSSFKYYGIGRVKEIAASGKRAYVEWPDYDRKKLLFGQPTPAYYLISKLQKVTGDTP
ncbi:hypothetical protein QNH38_08085 [Paenibacillus polymyxa]|uniref:hypothetical protein n=1 Tax=Paenibacillus polymyxa TaxID=1406 RepID=UPI0024BFE380|nr:hypothetical protein [Paenibacillus polymyxa]WHX37390.1 hypothetical protein QNH38_08085 [Paenibacillus polymyxa]